MHIPDGYLSPQTCIPLWGAVIPIWVAAARKVRQSLRTRQVPLLALGAAFSFVVMMFNVPLPGGSSGHATGGALVAILLGPWAACVAITLALAIQAFLFGDGGIVALSANCLTMAVVVPFVASWCYRLVAGRTSPDAPRRTFAAFAAGYVALNVAALDTAILFGIQPLIASSAGRPLYAPYPLTVAVPAMVLPHLLVFGPLEGVVTALVLGYLRRTGHVPLAAVDTPKKVMDRLWWGIGILAALTPAGLALSLAAGAGGAWGEWHPAELAARTGFLPDGMARSAHLWHAPFADYSLGGLGVAGTLLAYGLCAVLGTAALVCCVRIGGRFLAVREEK